MKSKKKRNFYVKEKKIKLFWTKEKKIDNKKRSLVRVICFKFVWNSLFHIVYNKVLMEDFHFSSIGPWFP
jgi:hypothetical protein